MRRPRYCQRFDAGTIDLASEVADYVGESLQEFIEYAIVMRALETTISQGYRELLGSKAEDQYGIVHQYWENRARNDKIREGKLPF